jgi:hypothetical protein
MLADRLAGASNQSPGEPLVCNDLFIAAVHGARGRAYPGAFPESPFYRGWSCVSISATVDAHATPPSLRISPRPSRIAHRPPLGRLLRSPSAPPPHHPRPCICRVHRVSPRRLRFYPRSIIREYQETRNRTSKTDGKIKRCHLDCVGPCIAKRFSVAGHLANSRGGCLTFAPCCGSRMSHRAPR